MSHIEPTLQVIEIREEDQRVIWHVRSRQHGEICSFELPAVNVRGKCVVDLQNCPTSVEVIAGSAVPTQSAPRKTRASQKPHSDQPSEPVKTEEQPEEIKKPRRRGRPPKRDREEKHEETAEKKPEKTADASESTSKDSSDETGLSRGLDEAREPETLGNWGYSEAGQHTTPENLPS